VSDQIIPAIVSFVIVAALSPLLIIVLRNFGLIQPIRKELPSDHQLKKRHTIDVWNHSFCWNHRGNFVFPYALNVFLINYIHFI